MLFILIKKDTSIIHGSDTGGVQLTDLGGSIIINTSLRIIHSNFPSLFCSYFSFQLIQCCKLKLSTVRVRGVGRMPWKYLFSPDLFSVIHSVGDEIKIYQTVQLIWPITVAMHSRA
jgi:hypothetical protein